jgi:hypothetical protein
VDLDEHLVRPPPIAGAQILIPGFYPAFPPTAEVAAKRRVA